MRLDAANFQASASQTRCLRRNRDLRMTITDELDNPDALALYARYQTEWHAATLPPDPEEVRSFLADSAVETWMVAWWAPAGLMSWLKDCPASISPLTQPKPVAAWGSIPY